MVFEDGNEPLGSRCVPGGIWPKLDDVRERHVRPFSPLRMHPIEQLVSVQQFDSEAAGAVQT